MELVIHMDPVDSKDPLTRIVKQQLLDVTAEIEEIVGVHDVRVVPGYTHHNLLFDIVVAAGAKQTDSELRNLVNSKMKQLDPKYNCVIEVDHNYAGDCH